jgi:epoxide hydrolase-like predicted phosphatase
MAASSLGPRALIVDWGGVLTTPIEPAFRTWLAREGLSEEPFFAMMTNLHNQADSILHQVERGEAPPKALERELASRLTEPPERQIDSESLLERMFAAVEVNQDMAEVLAFARNAGWRTAVLSNSWGNTYDEPLLNSLVDAVLLSDRIGMRKPESACYELAASTLGVSPADCVFVDDLRRNVRGAERAGMTALHYGRTTEATLRVLIGGTAT